MSLLLYLSLFCQSDATLDVPTIVEQVTPSVVTITFEGRDGKQQGLGSGFVVRADGLIATNLHVLGEARPIAVTLADGRLFDVEEVFASDKLQDLAVLKIEVDGLQPLTLAQEDRTRTGQDVIAIGHPLGREYSVARGIISAQREEIGGRPMIQLSMPIERGNSGGPVLDLQGNVVGLVTLKSLEADDLGYAVPVAALNDMLAKPNPTPMSRWLTIGRLDDSRWLTPDDDVRWRQRAGQIAADGKNVSVGGRSLCLSKLDVPAGSYELSVETKMEENDGAAGLCFAVDEQGRHYGFYPSSGRLRVARFDGSSVYTWNVLGEQDGTSYRVGDWNHLRVSVSPDRIQCWCNDEPVFDLSDRTYRASTVGLIKFRHTTAAFRQFRLGETVPTWRPDDVSVDAIAAAVERWREDRNALPVRDATAGDSRAESVLEDLALELEREADRLRQLRADLRTDRVSKQLAETLDGDQPDRLLKAALLLGALDTDDVDTNASLTQFARLAEELDKAIPKDGSDAVRRATLDRFFFKEWGFHGGRMNYYSRSNSFLNEALDDREGLPITLSVLYAAFAREIDLKVVGVGLPGHFVVRYTPKDGDSELIDVFEGGETLTLGAAASRVMGQTGRPLTLEDLAEQSDKEIILRMLRNLIGAAERAEDLEASLRYAKTIVAVDPSAVPDMLYAAVQCYNTKRYQEGLSYLNAALSLDDGSLSIDRVERLRQALEEKAAEAGSND